MIQVYKNVNFSLFIQQIFIEWLLCVRLSRRCWDSSSKQNRIPALIELLFWRANNRKRKICKNKWGFRLWKVVRRGIRKCRGLENVRLLYTMVTTARDWGRENRPCGCQRESSRGGGTVTPQVAAHSSCGKLESRQGEHGGHVGQDVRRSGGLRSWDHFNVCGFHVIKWEALKDFEQRSDIIWHILMEAHQLLCWE